MIATTKRPGNVSYIDQCLDSLLEVGISRHVAVMNTDLEPNHELHNRMAQKYRHVRIVDRPDWLPAAKIEIPFSIVYGSMNHHMMLKAENDTEARKSWRTKEVLDFVHFSERMLYEYPTTPWFLFLQDDAVLKEEYRLSFHQNLRELIDKKSSPVFKLSRQGNVALLFHRAFLQSFAAYSLLRHDKLPIDWLLNCHTKELRGSKHIPIFRYFAHVGVQSSFQNNTQRNVDEV